MTIPYPIHGLLVFLLACGTSALATASAPVTAQTGLDADLVCSASWLQYGLSLGLDLDKPEGFPMASVALLGGGSGAADALGGRAPLASLPRAAPPAWVRPSPKKKRSSERSSPEARPPALTEPWHVSGGSLLFAGARARPPVPRGNSSAALTGRAGDPITLMMFTMPLVVAFVTVFCVCGGLFRLNVIGQMLSIFQGSTIEWPDRASELIAGKWMVVDMDHDDVRFWMCENEQKASAFFNSIPWKARAMFDLDGKLVKTAVGMSLGSGGLSEILSKAERKSRSLEPGFYMVIAEDKQGEATFYPFSSSNDAQKFVDTFTVLRSSIMLHPDGRELCNTGPAWKVGRLRVHSRMWTPGMVHGCIMVLVELGANVVYVPFTEVEEHSDAFNYFDSLGYMPRVMFSAYGDEVRSAGMTLSAFDRIRMASVIYVELNGANKERLRKGRNALAASLKDEPAWRSLLQVTELKKGQFKDWTIVDRRTQKMEPCLYMVVIETRQHHLKLFKFAQACRARAFFNSFDIGYTMILYEPTSSPTRRVEWLVTDQTRQVVRASQNRTLRSPAFCTCGLGGVQLQLRYYSAEKGEGPEGGNCQLSLCMGVAAKLTFRLSFGHLSTDPIVHEFDGTELHNSKLASELHNSKRGWFLDSQLGKDGSLRLGVEILECSPSSSVVAATSALQDSPWSDGNAGDGDTGIIIGDDAAPHREVWSTKCNYFGLMRIREHVHNGGQSSALVHGKWNVAIIKDRLRVRFHFFETPLQAEEYFKNTKGLSRILFDAEGHEIRSGGIRFLSKQRVRWMLKWEFKKKESQRSNNIVKDQFTRGAYRGTRRLSV